MERNKNQQVHVITDAGHAPFLTDPNEFLMVIESFVSSFSYRLNKKRIARSFSRAAKTYDAAAQLQRDIGDNLFASVIVKQPSVVVDLGCGTGHYTHLLKDKYPDAGVYGLDLAEGMLNHLQANLQSDQTHLPLLCSDAESLPLQAQSVDLLFSNLAIQWCQNLEQLFFELYRVLTIDGIAYITTFQEGTLRELRQAWQYVDDRVHVNQFFTVDQLRDAAVMAGFSATDIKQKTYLQYYQEPSQLTGELKALGAHNVNQGQQSGLTGKQKFREFSDAYEKCRVDAGLPAHYEVVTLVLRKNTQAH